MALQIAFSVEDNCTTLIMKGDLNEFTSALDSVEVNPNFNLHIDMRELGAVNSLGVRNFSSWIHGIKCQHLRLFYCPRSFVTQMSLVKDFLPEKCEIESFFVPYYSESTGEEERVLFTKFLEYRKDAGGNLILNVPDILDSSGQKMDLDVFQDQYFRFLEYYF